MSRCGSWENPNATLHRSHLQGRQQRLRRFIPGSSWRHQRRKYLDEARAMAAEALALHLEGLAEDGEAVPEPSTLEEIMAVAENKDGVPVLVDAPAA